MVEWPLSMEDDKPCFRKPCACLSCRPVGFCVDDRCAMCNGEDADRTDDFCEGPTAEEEAQRALADPPPVLSNFVVAVNYKSKR